MKLFVCSLAAVLLFFLRATAASIGPDYVGSYTAFDLGSVAGLPPLYGGLTFAEGDPNTLLIGGRANSAQGLFYSTPVIRDAAGHITSFGTPTALGFGAYNDGGIAYGPGGVLFYSRWPVNQMGEVKPGSTTDARVIDLGPLGVASSHAALGFVPAGYSGAGGFKMLSWSGGQFYNAVLSPDGTGTYDLASAILATTLPGGPEQRQLEPDSELARRIKHLQQAA